MNSATTDTKAPDTTIGDVFVSSEQTLNEIRSGRRLGKIVSSIESFLQSQITRLEASIDECQKVADNDRIVQELLANFEMERANWEKKRESEIKRLKDAGDQLAEGWRQLEEERKKWLDQIRNTSEQ